MTNNGYDKTKVVVFRCSEAEWNFLKQQGDAGKYLRGILQRRMSVKMAQEKPGSAGNKVLQLGAYSKKSEK